MNYFLTEDDLDKAVNAVFSAVAKLFSEKDEELKRKLKELEANFLLLINTLGQRSHQFENKHNKGVRKMEEEPRAVRNFDEVLEDLIEYVLQSEDHDLILLADELHESAKVEIEKREKTTGKLREIFKTGRAFMREQEEGEKKEKEEK